MLTFGTVGIILGVFFGCLIICYVFFIPFFERKLIKKDARLRIWHIPLGPLLKRENPPLYFPGKGEQYVTNYYEDACMYDKLDVLPQKADVYKQTVTPEEESRVLQPMHQ